jgi:hypothetical protein
MAESLECLMCSDNGCFCIGGIKFGTFAHFSKCGRVYGSQHVPPRDALNILSTANVCPEAASIHSPFT